MKDSTYKSCPDKYLMFVQEVQKQPLDYQNRSSPNDRLPCTGIFNETVYKNPGDIAKVDESVSYTDGEGVHTDFNERERPALIPINIDTQ